MTEISSNEEFVLSIAGLLDIPLTNEQVIVLASHIDIYENVTYFDKFITDALSRLNARDAMESLAQTNETFRNFLDRLQNIALNR
jgi:hypothetical protein